jgi:hypothetical protein
MPCGLYLLEQQDGQLIVWPVSSGEPEPEALVSIALYHSGCGG